MKIKSWAMHTGDWSYRSASPQEELKAEAEHSAYTEMHMWVFVYDYEKVAPIF